MKLLSINLDIPLPTGRKVIRDWELKREGVKTLKAAKDICAANGGGKVHYLRNTKYFGQWSHEIDVKGRKEQ